MGLRNVASLLLFDYRLLHQQQQDPAQATQPQSMLLTMALGMPMPGLSGGASQEQLAAAERSALHSPDVHDASLLKNVESRLLKL
jgi:hypothetical protein